MHSPSPFLQTPTLQQLVSLPGAYALIMAGVLGITSLPSVASSMTWREFAFVQSVLGWVTLVAGTMHLILDEWDRLITPQFVCYLPSCGQVCWQGFTAGLSVVCYAEK